MQPSREPFILSHGPVLVTEDSVTMNGPTLVTMVLPLALMGTVTIPTITGLIEVWSGRDDYSHGYLVPLISGYLAWTRREVLLKMPVQPAPWMGALVLGISGLGVLLAQLGGLITPGGVALMGMVFGLVLLLAGVEWTKQLLVPIAYLGFCVPILDFVVAPLQWPFQLLTAEMSTKALQGLGVPAFLEGNRIMIPEVTMEVATQCSGASLLIAVAAIAIPLAYVNLRLWWTRVGLLMFGVAVAIVANWARVTVIGLYAHMGGKELHGPMHIFQGLSVAWVGFIGVFIGAWIFGRIEQRRAVVMSTPSSSQARTVYRFSEGQRSRVQQAGWIGVVVLVALAGVMYGLTPIPTSMRQDFSSFPREIGSWRGEQVGSDDAFVRVHGADVELVREYVTASGGGKLQSYVAYVEQQGQGKEIVNDQTGQLHQQLSQVSIVGTGAEVANIGRVKLKRESREVVFWYDDNGLINTDRRRAKLSMLLSGLFHRRTNGALVVISTPVTPDGDGMEAREELMQFARTAYPILQAYLP